MHPILFELGPVTVYTYGVLLAAAYLLGLKLAMVRAKARGMDEAAEVTDFVEPALRWERHDAGDVVEHMRARAGPRIELGVDRESGGGEQAGEGIPARAGLAALDPGDHRLGRAGAVGELALGEAGALARLAE